MEVNSHILEILKKVKQNQNIQEVSILSNYLDSLELLEFVSLIEKQFSIVIPDEEINLDNFRDLDSLTNLVSRYMND